MYPGVIEVLYRDVQKEVDALTATVAVGRAEDFAQYKYLCGKIAAYKKLGEMIEQAYKTAENA